MNGNTIMNNSATPIFARSLAAAIVAGISLAGIAAGKVECAYIDTATPARVPQIRFLYSSPVKPGELAKDPTHSPVFGERFKEIADRRGVKCEIGYGNRNNFGDAFTWLADTL